MLTVDSARALEHRVRARGLKARLFGLACPPVRIGRYGVESVIGSGAMGVVYAARDERLDRRVAVKVLRPELARGAARIEREARALARLSHPNVVTLHEVGEDDGHTFLVMEHVTGESLRSWLAAPRPLAARLGVLIQAAHGLAAAHELALVHRDFKPENAIVGTDGRLRIVDFGLAVVGESEADETSAETTAGVALAIDARITQTGQLVGTPAYLAPELLAGGRPTPRSDQFAFACVAWEALFGAHPFAPGQSREIAPVIPRRPALPRRLTAALVRGLSADPQARHDDLTAFARALAVPHGPARRIGIIAMVGAAGILVTLLVRRDGPEASVPAQALATGARAAARPGIVAPACSVAPSFERPRATLERTLQQLETLRRATDVPEADPADVATVDVAFADAELALGRRDAACGRLRGVLARLPAHDPAACWAETYCGDGHAMPARALCLAGDAEACGKASILHEYELLEASGVARRGTDDQAEVLRAAHRELLLDVLARGCELGAADLCAEHARQDRPSARRRGRE